jgi:hypothetical protein
MYTLQDEESSTSLAGISSEADVAAADNVLVETDFCGDFAVEDGQLEDAREEEVLDEVSPVTPESAYFNNVECHLEPGLDSHCFPATASHGAPIGRYTSRFERLHAEIEKEKKSPWYPFADMEEWELARWLVMSGLSQSEIDNFLKMFVVSL